MILSQDLQLLGGPWQVPAGWTCWFCVAFVPRVHMVSDQERYGAAALGLSLRDSQELHVWKKKLSFLALSW